MSGARALSLTPETHRPHAMHGGQRDWVESNCYLDVWVELLHALDLDPVASLGFTLASDFEADQWTFSKPSNFDVIALYGLSIEEMTVWRSIEEHCLMQLQHGRLPLIEVDAFHLPDAAQTDYRTNHVKTTIAVSAIDTRAQTLEYFHNAGCFRLESADYRGLFGLDPEQRVACLPPYCEIVKLHRRVRRSHGELRRIAMQHARQHLARGPEDNPVQRFANVFDGQMQRVISEGESVYHDYAFATLRQLGSASEYAAIHLDWLAGGEPGALASAARELRQISTAAKGLLMKAARMSARGRVSDTSSQLQAMTSAWTQARAALTEALLS